jgi:hypothetical protein
LVRLLGRINDPAEARFQARTASITLIALIPRVGEVRKHFPTGTQIGLILGMSNESPPIERPRRRLPRVPAFYPVPLRATHNGWAPKRQAHFLGWLAETGSVSAACERVGMSRKSAYALRKKPGAESFAAAWDAALGKPAPKVTTDDLHFLAYQGLIRPRFRAGKYIGSSQKPDNSAALKLLARFDRLTYWGKLGG